MNICFKAYQEKDIPLMQQIWNEILQEGLSFPGDTLYEEEEFTKMLLEQSGVTCLFVDDQLAGYYILHPNNIGRCSHIANASYAIQKDYRGKKLAEPLVRNSLEEAKRLGFMGMQYNAVVTSNVAAIHTYQKIGFQIIGTIPKGYRLKNGDYSDMYIMFFPFG